MLALAKRPEGSRTPTQVIQKEMLVPRAFLLRIVADLSKKGLIRTYSGPNGGLQLSRPKQAITLRDVYEAIEGPLLISDCLQSPVACPLEVACPVHPRWRRLQHLIVEELATTTLEQLSAEAWTLAGRS
jgi:Rrf2 family protein